MAEDYTTINLRIFKRDHESGLYPVEASINGGRQYEDQLDIDQTALLAKQDDPKAYGLELFSALFSDRIRRAYNIVTGQAISQSEGRLRVRLRIDDGAPELHAIRWEALYHTYRNEAIPLAISADTPFSRYTVLEASEATPLQPPLRLLFAIANPSDLANDGLTPLDVDAEVRSLVKALGKVDPTRLEVQILPGRTGLSKDLQVELNAAGIETIKGPTSLENLSRHLSDCHIFHFLGHGVYSKSGEKAVLVLEHGEKRKWGQSRWVVDVKVTEQLRPLNNLRLVFLAACESAKRETDRERPNPFVGLAPKLMQAGVPAVVAMQDRVETRAARRLTAQFYRELIRHGYVDQALNTARYTLYSDGNEQWTIPVLYMRLADGRLFFTAVRPGVTYHSLNPPVHYVSRPLVSERLEEQLLHGAGAPAIMLIHGMAASGKTTFAKALAQAVWSYFIDGVFWITLGQEPELSKQLSGLTQELGDYDFQPLTTTVEQASQHLDGLLAKRQVLLVLDDAWEYGHVKPFLVGGSRCHVLITSRRGSVLSDYSGQPTIYRLRQLTENQALDMLVRLLHRTTDPPFAPKEREEALVLAKAVGHLPMALELASRRIDDGSSSWQKMTKALETEIARLEELDPDPGRRRIGSPKVEASINLSLRWLREKFEPDWEALVWLGVLPEDATISAPAAATLWQVSPEEANDILTLLDDDNLLLEAPAHDINGRSWPAYALHDLVHDVARRQLTAPKQPKKAGDLPGLGLSWRQANEELLNRYQDLAEEGLWHTLPADGYIQANLTWHMEQAGQFEKIHALLREETENGLNGWYMIQERLGNTAVFVADVARAQQLAEAKPRIIGHQCRYAMVISSINSLAANLPTGLPNLLVKEGVWIPEQALAYVCQVPDLEDRTAFMTTLAPMLPGEVFEAAQAIWSEKHRATVLTALSRYLPERSYKAALALKDEEYRGRVLAALAPHLPEAVYEAVLAIKHERHRATVLAALVPYMPETVYEAVKTIDAEKPREEVLTALAPHLPEKVCEVAQVIGAVGIRARVLTTVSPNLPESKRAEVLTQALQAAQAVEDKAYRAQSLTAVAIQLPETERVKVLNQALREARAIEDERSRAKVLANLAPQLPETKRTEALSLALQATQTMWNKVPQLDSLRALMPLTPDKDVAGIVDKRLKTVEVDRSMVSWAEVLTSLIPQLPAAEQEKALYQALMAAQAITGYESRIKVLMALAPFIPEKVYDAAKTIDDANLRGKVLTVLAPHLPQVIYEKAQSSEDEASRAEVLTAVAPYLPDEERAEALDQARQAAQNIGDVESRADALAMLVPHLPEVERTEMVSQVLEATKAIKYEVSRVEILAALVPHMSEAGRAEAMRQARDIEDERIRVKILTAVAPYLPGAVYEATQAIMNEGYQAEVLTAVAPYLPQVEQDDVLKQALEVAQDIKVAWSRAWALLALAPQLPQAEQAEVLSRALEVTKTIGDERMRAQVLMALGPLLPDETYKEAHKIKHKGSYASVLQKLAPFLPELVYEAAQANEDEYQYRAWILTAVAPHLKQPEKPEVLRQAFQAAQKIRDAADRTKVLSALAPHLPQAVYKEAHDLGYASYRVTVMMAVAPYLSGPERVEALTLALQAALAIRIERERERFISTLAPMLAKLPQAKLYNLWRQMLPRLARRDRWYLLSDLKALLPVIEAVGGQEALSETAAAIIDVGRWWP